jgi:MFS transporter, SP family, solute carrier family 2 (myo-inositol transporter), member 13
MEREGYNTFQQQRKSNKRNRKSSIEIDMNSHEKKSPKNRAFLYYLAALASVGGMLFGYDTGVVSGAIIQLRSDPDKFDKVGGMNLSDFEQEMVVGIATAGAILGSILSSMTNKNYGRRITIMGSSVAFVIGAAVMGIAPNVEILLIGRLIVGISVGFASHTVPIYLAEVSPDDVRGLLVSLNNVSIVAGQVLASLVDCGFGLGEVPGGWRYMLALGGVPGVVLFFGFWYLPASPRWLLSQDLRDEAQASLQRIRSASSPAAVDVEFKRIETHISEARSIHKDHPVTLSTLREYAPELTVGCGLQLLQQLAGINTLMYYSSTILSSSADTDENDSPWSSANNQAICLSALTAFAQLVGVFLGMLMVDRMGRRPLTMGSLTVVALSLVLLGFAFFRQQSQPLALTGMILYLISFGLGMSPMPWLINAEIYPIHIRSSAISISTGVNWVSNLIVSSTFLSLAKATSTDRSDPGKHPDMAFWIYGVISVLGLIWVSRTLPETKGKSLEEIGLLFRGGKSGRHTRLQSRGDNSSSGDEEEVGGNFVHNDDDRDYVHDLDDDADDTKNLVDADELAM